MKYNKSILGYALAASMFSLSAAATAQQATSPPAIDPEALAALDRMAASLRELNTIAFDADVTEEKVLTNSQKLQFGSTLKVRATRPDKLNFEVISDRQTRQYYFDGQTLSIVAPKLNYFTQVPLSGSIMTVVDGARREYDIELPLADIFAWDSNPELRNRIKSGYVVRPESIGGKTCTHYAFRQANVDWQIWIADEGPALPCKLVITDTSDAARPQYSARFDWLGAETATGFNYTYSPTPDMQRISIAKVKDAVAKGGSK